MSQYKLFYFDGRGRAEVSRMLFVAAGVQFEDVRIKDWPASKADAPLGQLPYLIVDDTKLPQSIAIARFLANRFNLAGKTDIEKAQVDVIVDTVSDLYFAYYTKVYAAAEGPDREAVKNSFISESLDSHLEKLEKLSVAYGSSGYAVGQEYSWADIALFELTELVLAQCAGAFSKYPALSAIRKSTESHPILGEYIKSRPVTPF